MSEYIDNQSKRRETLKRLIRQLHEGRTVDEVKEEFAALLRDVGAQEIAEIEQALIAEGMPDSEIKRLCDVHVAVFRESLDSQSQPEMIPGHPVHTFQAENAAAAQVLDALEAAVGASQWEQARAHLRKLQAYEKHYLRKENILFPYLEQHGLKGPAAVMWAIHDDVRAGWKKLGGLLDDGPRADGGKDEAVEVLEALGTAIRDMFYKEEHILFPAALETLSQGEWAAIRAQGPEVGYCYVEPGDQWSPRGVPHGEEGAGTTPLQVREGPAGGLIPLDTGALTAQQVNWMLTHLPVDVTYVDQDDAVRFFSATKERIFPRSPAIIGRKVQQCHPPASVHRVQRILDDFRAGRRDEAEFWIQMGGRFIHIRYFAVRDERGAYQGTLEVSQDVTDIRALEGERRLLEEGD